jgi:hypothetical protein
MNKKKNSVSPIINTENATLLIKCGAFLWFVHSGGMEHITPENILAITSMFSDMIGKHTKDD